MWVRAGECGWREPVRGERRGSGSRRWQVSASREWAARGKSGGRSSAGVGVLGTQLDFGVSFQKGGVIHMAAPPSPPTG